MLYKKKISKSNDPFISIIIPLYVIEERFFNDFKKFEKLKYNNFEIIVVCDKQIKLPEIKRDVRFLLAGEKQTGPAEKRDLAIKVAKGEICAFIDDDAYPDPNWLKNAAENFKNLDIIATGGPGLTPPENSFWQKIGGYILQSYFGSGGIQGRFYQVSNYYFVREHPAYNLFIRTDVLKKVGSYGTTLYGGEDMIVCMKLNKYGKIFYDPDVVVYHHRRSFPMGHLKQISAVGMKRSYMMRKFSDSPKSISFFIPTLLTLGLFLGILLSVLFPQTFLIPFSILFATLWFLGTVSVLKQGVGLFSALITGLGIMATHMAYGLYFIPGLFIKHMDR